MTPIALILLIILSVFVLTLPRQWVTLPFIFGACYIPFSEKIMLGQLDLTVIRILITLGVIRLIIKSSESKIEGGINGLDKIIIAWVLFSTVNYMLLWKTSNSFINRLGNAYNILGLYFLFRIFIRDIEDIRNTIKITAIMCIPLAILMLFEHLNGFNHFSIFGDVASLSWTRGGRFRAKGPFQHAILAGTFGATQFPLLWGLYRYTKGKMLFLGIVATMGMVVFCASSSPVLSFCVAILGLILWKQSENIKNIFIFFIVLLFVTDLFIMKAPIWYIFARLGYLMGGTGIHRSLLIDASIKHFGEWWLIGTNYTAHWLPWRLPTDPNMIDITNQYLLIGITTGLLPMVLFITAIVFSFKYVGFGVKNSNDLAFFFWVFGSSLFAHVVTFFSIAYFDQSIVFFYMLLAQISNIRNITYLHMDNSE